MVRNSSQRLNVRTTTSTKKGQDQHRQAHDIGSGHQIKQVATDLRQRRINLRILFLICWT
jgi:hypothetical protein